jgi:hypothetical protein
VAVDGRGNDPSRVMYVLALVHTVLGSWFQNKPLLCGFITFYHDTFIKIRLQNMNRTKLESIHAGSERHQRKFLWRRCCVLDRSCDRVSRRPRRPPPERCEYRKLLVLKAHRMVPSNVPPCMLHVRYARTSKPARKTALGPTSGLFGYRFRLFGVS